MTPPYRPTSFITRCTPAGADIVFADPPYDLEREYAAVLDKLAEAPPALIVLQHSTP